MENISVDMNNLNKTEREQLLTLVTKANKGKSKVCIPEDGEKYWVISSDGQQLSKYTWRGDYFEYGLLAIGNCFKTREEAEFEVERLKVIKELKDYALKHNESEIDWSLTNEKKWYIYYSHYYFDICSDMAFRTKLNTTYFTSSQIAENAIESIGKDRLKKYYFEIEE